MSKVDMSEITPTASFHLTFVCFYYTFVSIEYVEAFPFGFIAEPAILLDVFFAEDYSVRRAHHTLSTCQVVELLISRFFLVWLTFAPYSRSKYSYPVFDVIRLYDGIVGFVEVAFIPSCTFFVTRAVMCVATNIHPPRTSTLFDLFVPIGLQTS